ncbi:hypothetical protein RB195_021461 [Necator americanus]|uniref:G-protein coupled receptors family 1 profile domain-containing protein n=1 Tax=Necator americanus TaxID=51031 RepID=A0ABR1EB39_NECAM
MNSTSPSGAATVANIAYCYVLPMVCAIGVIGNITNLVVLASRRLRAVSYMYLRALAVADLLCMIFVLLFVTTEILTKNGAPINQYKVYQIYQCHFMLTLINWALGAGVYVVVALSLERYISIVFPMHFREWNSPRRATNAIAIAYIIPALLYVPYAITRYKSIEKWDENVNATIYRIDDHEVYRTIPWQIYKWTRETILRFLPIVTLSVLNIQIMIAFRRRQKMFHKLTKRNEQGAHKDDTLMYMLGGTVFMSLVCNIPAAINLLLIDEKTYANRSRLRSFVKRTQSAITRDKDSSNPPTSSPKAVDSHLSKTSRTGQAEPETVDVHLASGEESLSDGKESDSLIKYGAVAKLSTDTNVPVILFDSFVQMETPKNGSGDRKHSLTQKCDTYNTFGFSGTENCTATVMNSYVKGIAEIR